MIYKSEKSYVDEIKPIARKVGLANNYLPSVLCAQCIQETGYGGFVDKTTESMIDHKNHLGMKSSLLNATWKEHSVWNGQSFSKRTPEWYSGRLTYITDSFRVYESIEQCLTDFVMFMTWVKRDNGQYKYRNDVIGNSDPASTIRAVRVNGYCTDPSYDSSILKIIQKWNLAELDEGFGKVAEKKGEAVSNKNVKKLAAPRFIDNRAASKSQVPAWRNKSDKKYIVVHYLGVCGQNSELWDNGYGATFTIFWNGDVYYTADYTAVTWQCGGEIQGESRDGSGVAPHRFYRQCTNYNSVSIETCVKRTDGKYEGDDNDDKWYFTEESQESLVWAVSKMMDDLNITIDRVIRHFDVTGKICPNPYVRNNKLHGNWTWEEFKVNLAQYRKDGTITIPDRSGKKAEPTVEKWYRVRKSWSDESSQLGAYVSLDNAKANCPTGYAVYDWNGKEIYMNKPETLTKTQTQFLNAVKAVCDLARKEGWKYGDSRTSVPCLDKIISCDRMVARALYNLGFKDQRIGGEVCTTLPTYLVAHEWKATTNTANIKPGAIVAVRQKDHSYIDHVFVVTEYNEKTGRCAKYDCGSKARIDSSQPFKNVKLMEWANKVFVAAWNVPDKFEPDVIEAQPDEEVTPKKTTTVSTVYKGVNYSPVYNYTYYRKKYADLREKYGTDKKAYFDHFCKWGMKEGRKACATFDVNKYRKRYADLQKAFGDDLPAYYKHFVVYGKKEGRNGK